MVLLETSAYYVVNSVLFSFSTDFVPIFIHKKAAFPLGFYSLCTMPHMTVFAGSSFMLFLDLSAFLNRL